MSPTISIGHLVVKPGQTGAVWPEDQDLLVFTLRGTSEYLDTEDIERVAAGDILFVPRLIRGVTWRSKGDSDWEVFWFFTRLDRSRQRLLDVDTKPAGMRRWQTVGLTRVRIEAAFRRLAQLQGIKHQSADTLRNSLADVILSELRLDNDTASRESDQVVAEARAFLDSRIPEPTSVEDLVEALGVGRTSLLVRFSKAMKVSPMKYLEERRLLTAAERLRSSLDPIAAVARTVGYSDNRYFATRFRRRFGCTPGEWRERER